MSSQLPNQPTTRNKVFLNPLTHTKGLAEIILVQWFSMQWNCKGSVKKRVLRVDQKSAGGLRRLRVTVPEVPHSPLISFQLFILHPRLQPIKSVWKNVGPSGFLTSISIV